MPFDVYDYRTDVRNVVITPEIRSRFLRMEPGEVAVRHSHDLGHEVFLILEGQCEFEIEGHREVLGPGQMCFARVDQRHQVRTVGDVPMTMYLSVTPHIEPTHTFWDDQGAKLPNRYGAGTSKERAASTDPLVSLDDILSQQVATAKALAEAATASAHVQETETAAMQRALDAGDTAAAKAAVDAMWEHISQTFQSLYALGAVWNDLAARVEEP